jgi:FkbM family methyltransferase
MARISPATTEVVQTVAPENVPCPPELLASTVTVETRHGQMSWPVHDDPIGRSLSEYGEWAFAELEVLRAFAVPGTTVIDIGANLGTHTLTLAREVGPDGRVLAIEPQRSIFALLAHNVRSNGLTNVELLRVCAGAENGTAVVPDVDLNLHFNFGGVLPQYGEASEGESVAVVPLDLFNVANVSLMKIDVEGSEARVLAGAAQTIDSQRPVVYFEANSLEDAAPALRFVHERGYTTFFHRAPAYNPHNFRHVTANTFGFATETNILAVPCERLEGHKVALANPQISAFSTLDELARLLMESPRYGDETPFDRVVPVLRDRLSETHARVGELDQSLDDRARAVSEMELELRMLSQERAVLRDELDRVRTESARTTADLGRVVGQRTQRIQELEEALRDAAENEAQYELHRENLNERLAQRTREGAKLKSDLGAARKRYDEHVRKVQTDVQRSKQRTSLGLIRRSLSTEAKKRLRRVVKDGVRGTMRRFSKYFARRARHRHERAIIERSGLFDVDYYREQAGRSRDPIGHYLERGAAKGLNPHPLFNTAYYSKLYPDVTKSPMNPFVHYLEIGAQEGRSPNRFFDGEFYREQTPELAKGVNPIAHFLSEGALQGRMPNKTFDPIYYLAINHEVKQAGFNPLVHYVRWGVSERRLTQAARPSEAEALKLPAAPPPTAPTADEWAAVIPRTMVDPIVDVIVPVYRGQAETLRCIHRVLTSTNRTEFALIVLDDASPEPELSAALVELAGRGLFTYLRNDWNRGFVATVNRGMALHARRDVVLLNSDTEVFGDWLDRMLRVAELHSDVGTITPFSNSATICSYPLFPRDNEAQLEVSYAELDALAARVNEGAILDLPTGVGFCMYIRRACLDATGVFDEERFGKGYGEENDFCLRAQRLNWRNVMACDVFVRHTGGASFQGEKSTRIAQALRTLDSLYPSYQEDVKDFILADPVRVYRERLDVERLQRFLVGRRSIAFLSHGRGGGTEVHVQQLAAMAREEGLAVILLRPNATNSKVLRVSIEDGILAPNLPLLHLDDAPRALAFFTLIGIRHLHVHHLVDLAPQANAWLQAIAQSGLVAVDYTIHDYSPICPRINLIDASDVYCGEPIEAQCNQCIAASGSEYGMTAIGPFRRRYERMLSTVRHVFVPDLDVKNRIERYFPELDIVVRPHPERPVEGVRLEPLRVGERLRVVAIGAIGIHKGFHVLLNCAEDARRRALPIDFVVVGYTCNDRRARRSGVQVTGPYADDAAAAAELARVNPHVAFFPAVWPETYSYVLSLALNAGLFPLAFDFGAIARRMREAGDGMLLPLSAMSDAEAINDVLLSLRAGPLPSPKRPQARSYRLADYYKGDASADPDLPSKRVGPRAGKAKAEKS